MSWNSPKWCPCDPSTSKVVQSNDVALFLRLIGNFLLLGATINLYLHLQKPILLAELRSSVVDCWPKWCPCNPSTSKVVHSNDAALFFRLISNFLLLGAIINLYLHLQKLILLAELRSSVVVDCWPKCCAWHPFVGRWVEFDVTFLLIVVLRDYLLLGATINFGLCK